VRHEERLQRRARDLQREWASGQAEPFLVAHNFRDVVSKTWRREMEFTFPVHVAASENNAEMVQLLLIAGADPSQLDWKGRTALQVAEVKSKRQSHKKVIEMLMKSATA
jgi:hypothetical protein